MVPGTTFVLAILDRSRKGVTATTCALDVRKNDGWAELNSRLLQAMRRGVMGAAVLVSSRAMVGSLTRRRKGTL